MTSSLNCRESQPGVLFLIVGPSGVGKDSLIDAARTVLSGNPQFVFPSRTITRVAEVGGEDDRAITKRDFKIEEAAGAFAFSWRAHGLAYGVPKTIADDLAAGRSVIVNVSRTIPERARRRFPNVRVISIVAPARVLERRLAERGRESKADIRKRLERANAYDVTGLDAIELVNDTTLDSAVERFVAILRKTA